MNNTIKLATAALMAGAASIAVAAAAPVTVTVNSVVGEWTSVSGGNALEGLNTNEVRWGSNGQSTATKSGYRFDGAAPPVQGPFGVGVVFDLGTFTHFNFPISAGTAITGATLKITIDATITNGITQNITLSSFFDFAHNETSNFVDPSITCPDGTAAGSGVNVNGCADIVTPTLNVGASDSIVIDGQTYVFSTTGFDIGSSFATVEQATNTATLKGTFTVRPTPPIQTSEPGLIGLFGLGLLGLGYASRRRAK